MSGFAAAILYLGILLQVCLVGRLLFSHLWHRYPWFSACVVWSLARTLLFFVTPSSLYTTVYWTTNVADVFVRFLVVWELVRHLFPNRSSLIVWIPRGFAFVVGTLAILLVSTFWSYQAYASSHSVLIAMERSASFAQAVMTLGLLLAARYHGISLSRTLRTIALAFGAWTSIAMVNNAMIDLGHMFIPYWQIVRPLSFVVLIATWTWALWMKTADATTPEYAVTASDLAAWAENWNQTQSSWRRIKPS